jgi:hypothetical protein
MLILGGMPGGSALSGPVTYEDIALSLLLVGIAIGVSRWQKVGLEKDMTIATVRSFAQLVAVGYILNYIFKRHGSIWRPADEKWKPACHWRRAAARLFCHGSGGRCAVACCRPSTRPRSSAWSPCPAP